MQRLHLSLATRQNGGFTLVEISVVVVIIGLIIGGVLVGRDLIKSSEIRAQISQFDEVMSALNAFKAKYGYLPGDMPPSEASQLGFFTFTGTYAGKTCSSGFPKAYGNNDGRLSYYGETVPFWSHLSDANLIKGNLGGTAGSLINSVAAACSVFVGMPNISVSTYENSIKIFPAGRLSSVSILTVIANQYWWPDPEIYFSKINKINMFFLQHYSGSQNFATPRQFYQIDSKIDDGLPATGIVRDANTADAGTGVPNESTCTTTGVTPIQYNLSATAGEALNCAFMAYLF